MKCTDWFSGDVTPIHPGVYQRNYDSITVKFCKWDGFRWFSNWSTVDAAESDTYISPFQNEPWRGLIKEFKND